MDAERAVLEQEATTLRSSFEQRLRWPEGLPRRSYNHGAVRQRNDEPRAPAQQASDTCASAGDPKGLRACNPFGG
ncbi:Uncharacterised protein [Yersinia enterocolitica]|uniref:hypothetical protein n=1 Tax=Yersinia enterocolitica TaxID=630 RepID=UPI000281941F|nr:hypothetical protein [Yersinia enterocolitica]EKA27241.1 hypothetical protein YWA314_09891 [Yersinia enterocolitica subsp. enterocolitica WA-314]VTP79484.1 Uncharacterised protein [Yersinia enterocolitica subsp. enterocolitica]AJI81521.1 hypothetical protein CH47_946 [Yersinia enterocolitica]KGA70884.1 hypothetical protein DJ59_1032 [Yersinia enterocolitica]KGA78915.1 hypothetical protein DJ60_1161 [Yersinia enterocolitica]